MKPPMSVLILLPLLLSLLTACTSSSTPTPTPTPSPTPSPIPQSTATPKTATETPLSAARSEPYVSKIALQDVGLRQLAASIVQSYPAGDKEAQVNAIYRYVVENFNYYADPRYGEFIQGPNETLQVKGGDCEDLAILASSLLENLGIKTYLVLTKDHAYALVSGINPDNLWRYISASLEKQFLTDQSPLITAKEETFQLKAGYVWYLGGNGESFPLEIAKVGNSTVSIKELEISYSVSSSQPLEINILPSRTEWENMVQGKTYLYYPSYKKSGVYQTSGTGVIQKYGGIALENPNMADAAVNARVNFSYKPSFEGLVITY